MLKLYPFASMLCLIEDIDPTYKIGLERLHTWFKHYMYLLKRLCITLINEKHPLVKSIISSSYSIREGTRMSFEAFINLILLFETRF